MSKKQMPTTSIDAYKSLQPEQLRDIYAKILWALGQLGESTFEDLAVALKLPKERIWKRMSELSRMNLIYRPGTRKALSSGRSGFTWKLVEKDGSTQKVTESSPPGSSVGDYSKKLIQNKLF